MFLYTSIDLLIPPNSSLIPPKFQSYYNQLVEILEGHGRINLSHRQVPGKII